LTGEYSFSNTIPTISIVGSGADGWPNGDGSVDIHQMTTTDGITYNLNGITLTDGEIKFRQNNDWTINWGEPSFPTGVGIPSGNNITCFAGTYDVTFNRETGAYSFAIPTISIVGSAAGGWPGEEGNPGPIDIHQLTTTDNGSHFSIEGITLTDGFVKFRSNNDWTINWGGTALDEPYVLFGPNIPVTSGTYNVNFNRINNTLSVSLPIKSELFSVYPNPSNTIWNFTADDTIHSIIITDMLGKVVTTSTNNAVDASTLNTGLYFAKISTDTALFTLKVIRN
jgi:starch-binding outer membrane protein SusE/F